MSKSMQNIVFGVALMSAAGFLSAGADGSADPATAAPSGKQDLSTYLCKDVMRASGTDRDVAVGILHGYVQGTKGTTVYDASKLSTASDQFLEYCLDHPNEGALATMVRFVNASGS